MQQRQEVMVEKVVVDFPSKSKVEKEVRRLFNRNPGTIDTAHHIGLALGFNGQVTDVLHRLSDNGVIASRPIGDGTMIVFGPLLRRE